MNILAPRSSTRIGKLKDLVLQRAGILFRLAESMAKEGRDDLARRYCELILALSRRCRVRLPRRIKRRICKNCMMPLIPGVSCRIRLQSEGRGSRIVITCLKCGYIYRIPYKARRKEKWTSRSSTRA